MLNMKTKLVYILITAIYLWPLAHDCVAKSQTAHTAPHSPALITLNPQAFVNLKAQVLANPQQFSKQLKQLKSSADSAIKKHVRAVTEKTVKGPSNDPHDYVSLSPYRWPNPDTADGMPWIRKDGKVNPMRDQYDLPALDNMAMTLRTLSTAYYFLDQQKYARKAANILDMWFINPKTRMNPRVIHGQFIPGKTDGQCYGILETTRLIFAINAIALIEQSTCWNHEKNEAIKKWFTQYLHWLQTSKLGQEALSRPNNHSNWAITQIMIFATFVGDDQTAQKMIALAKRNIDSQIKADGSQPHELSRTRSLDYSEFSLRALLTLAWISKRFNSNLEHYTNAQGAGIRKALDFFAPHIIDKKNWPYKQIKTPKYRHFNNTLEMAQSLYPDSNYQSISKQLPAEGNDAQIFFEPTDAFALPSPKLH